MKTFLLISILATTAIAAEEKIDWKPCEKEVKEFCTTVKGNHEIHECLEEAPKGKVSKACTVFNSSLEGKFKDKHGHKH